MSKVFYPTNIGGMSIKWVDQNGNANKSKNRSELIIDHIATVSEVNKNDGSKRVFLEFFEETEKTLISENEYNTFLKIEITEAIKHDLEWMNMQNKSLGDKEHSHYINLDSLSITHIEVNDDFKFIRIHYDFCQNHFGCSNSRRIMMGAVYRLTGIPKAQGDVNTLITQLWDGPIVCW